MTDVTVNRPTYTVVVSENGKTIVQSVENTEVEVIQPTTEVSLGGSQGPSGVPGPAGPQGEPGGTMGDNETFDTNLALLYGIAKG